MKVILFELNSGRKFFQRRDCVMCAFGNWQIIDEDIQ